MQTYLAFDFGEKRVGVATGNDFTKTAEALTTISYKNKEQLFTEIQALIDDWQPHALVVGLPAYPDGNAHEMTAKAQRFANQMLGRFKLKVHLVDERYSSVAVKNGDDSLAAELILKQYLIS